MGLLENIQTGKSSMPPRLLLYGTEGTGKMILYQDGKKIAGTWSKKDRESQFKLTDDKGVGIKFNRGAIWFEILPTGNTVTY